MKKRSFWLITVLMTVALLGVFVMQLYYIREAYNLKSQLFDEQVNQTLAGVVNKVQRLNAAEQINKKDAENKIKHSQDVRQRLLDIKDLKQQFAQEKEQRDFEHEKEIEAYLNEQDSLIRVSYRKSQIVTENTYQTLSSRVPRVGGATLDIQMDAVVDKDFKLRAYSMRSKLFSPDAKTFNFSSPQSLPDTIRYLVSDPRTDFPLWVTLPKISDDLLAKFKKEELMAKRKLELQIATFGQDTFQYSSSKLLEDVAKEMNEVNIPLYRRINVNSLETLLKKEFLNHNITQQYNVQVKLAQKDSILYLRASNPAQAFLPANTYKTELFNNDIFRDPGMLFVSFPNKNSAILTNLGATLGSSIALLLVLVFIFSYTLYAILKQKKISEMKTDFINNMTHEFKTPVATIMIASEALKDPEIMEDKSRVKRLAGVIYDENVRLGNHIERVLSIARMEKNELKMENTEVDVNDLITIVLDSMSLQLQKRNAQVTLHTEATDAVILADELHLSNVMYNLIDNANKYSVDQPEITISTRNVHKHLVIEIADKGIGMTKENSKRIFDQFYRVPTGNLHDVKGFGLGLNYVQDIVKVLHGTIKVHSEKDKGTTFEISLPL